MADRKKNGHGRWTPDEDAALAREHAQGRGWPERAAEVLGRPAEGVKVRAWRLGLRRELELTTAQNAWLTTALEAGYEAGFDAAPNRALVALERMGLVERNPCSGPGRWTQWRATVRALNEWELT